MTTDEARQLVAYGSWANALVFAAADAISEEQLAASAASSFPSIAATLGHIVGAEWIWLRRWLGEIPTAVPDWVSKPTLADLKAHLAAVEVERSSFLASLSDAELDRVVSYRNLAGQAYAEPLDGLIRHVVNHSTYHRGQVATQLRQLGLTPPNTDLITYLRQAK
jgi:uncharacterized damage-inducible protein DinB